MKIAIPTADGRLAMHFGHCEQFAIIDVIESTGEIENIEMVTPPPHEPGVLPKWLGELSTNLIIAGGMGQRAISLFQANNIKVHVGAPVMEVKELIKEYFSGTLVAGVNACDH